MKKESAGDAVLDWILDDEDDDVGRWKPQKKRTRNKGGRSYGKVRTRVRN